MVITAIVYYPHYKGTTIAQLLLKIKHATKMTKPKLLVTILLVIFCGCSGAEYCDEEDIRSTEHWKRLRIDGIESYKAVEIPTHMRVDRSYARKKYNLKKRVKINNKILYEFENSYDYGVFKKEFNPSGARQLAVYCGEDNKVLIFYNVIFTSNDCKRYKCDWTHRFAQPSHCSSYGILKTNIICN